MEFMALLRFQMKRFRQLPVSSTVNCWEDTQWNELNTACFPSLRYLSFWSCPAWRLPKHNLSALLNSVTRREKTPVASQLEPLWSEKSSWQPLNCCNVVWPTLKPHLFRSPDCASPLVVIRIFFFLNRVSHCILRMDLIRFRALIIY